jgi:hypothetical protein
LALQVRHPLPELPSQLIGGMAQSGFLHRFDHQSAVFLLQAKLHRPPTIAALNRQGDDDFPLIADRRLAILIPLGRIRFLVSSHVVVSFSCCVCHAPIHSRPDLTDGEQRELMWELTTQVIDREAGGE